MNKTYAKRTTAQLGNHGVPLRCIIENEMGFSGLGKCMLVYAGRTVREMSRSSKTNPMYACTDGGRKWTQGARLCNGIYGRMVMAYRAPRLVTENIRRNI